MPHGGSFRIDGQHAVGVPMVELGCCRAVGYRENRVDVKAGDCADGPNRFVGEKNNKRR